MNLKRKIAVFTFLALTCALSAQEFLSGEFWLPFELPRSDFEIETPDQMELINQMLGEMRFIFAGMIYGFSFTYVPSDIRRGVEEVFELGPQGEIFPGDLNLEVYQTRKTQSRFFTSAMYKVNDGQKRRLAYWDSAVFPVAEGVGRTNFFLGIEQKIEASKRGILEAIRSYLRKRVYDKPKKISGFARFTEVPYFTIDAGEFASKVRTALDIREIEYYKSY